MDEVLAVLVLYKCNLKDSVTFQSLHASLVNYGGKLDILVYDNSPVAQTISFEEYEEMKIKYISDISNSGVSKAYNVASEIAKELNKKWLLLLDQDTHFPIYAIACYAHYIKQGKYLAAPILLSGRKCISPCYYKWGVGRALQEYKTGINTFKNISLLNSGLIIPMHLYIQSGGYNEKIELDFSDHYFINCIRKITVNFCLLEIKCNHLLSMANANVNQVLYRFDYYLRGAKEYKDWKISIVAFLRTIKLTCRFLNISFFKKYMKEFF